MGNPKNPPYMPRGVRLWLSRDHVKGSSHPRHYLTSLQGIYDQLGMGPNHEPVFMTVGGCQNQARIYAVKAGYRVRYPDLPGNTLNPDKTIAAALAGAYQCLCIGYGDTRPGASHDPGINRSLWELPFSRVPKDALFSQRCLNRNDVHQRFTLSYKDVIRMLPSGSHVFMKLRGSKGLRELYLDPEMSGEYIVQNGESAFGHPGDDGSGPLATALEFAYNALRRSADRNYQCKQDTSRWGIVPANG